MLAQRERKAKEVAKTRRVVERRALVKVALSVGPAVEITSKLIVHKELEVVQLALLDLKPAAAARHQAQLQRNRARPRVSTTGRGRLLP